MREGAAKRGRKGGSPAGIYDNIMMIDDAPGLVPGTIPYEACEQHSSN